MTVGKVIGNGFVLARDHIAHGLVAKGVRPNSLTVLGFLLTAAAGGFLALGAGDDFNGAGPWHNFLAACRGRAGLSSWNLWAGAMLILCAATDMLDGAVARLGRRLQHVRGLPGQHAGPLQRLRHLRRHRRVLRLARQRHDGAAGHAVRQQRLRHQLHPRRAETLIPRCRVGYWQRGERYAAILIGVFAFNVPAMLWQQALSPAFTVWRRIWYTRQITAGKSPAEDPRQGGRWDKLQPWHWPRGTWPYDVITGLNILYLIFAPVPATDVLRLIGS